jgi:hypothetical protein
MFYRRREVPEMHRTAVLIWTAPATNAVAIYKGNNLNHKNQLVLHHN